jgi:hypothetical protein
LITVDESNPLIASQNAEILRLRAAHEDNKKQTAARKQRFKELQERYDRLEKESKERYDRLETAHQEKIQECETYKQAFETKPHELQAQVNEYRGKLRDRDHRDKFRELAIAAGARSDTKALDDLWHASGYKPETDEIDEAKIKAAITGALSERDWLKSPAAAASANGAPVSGNTRAGSANVATLQPGPGASRGGASVKDDTDAVLESKYPNAYRIG